MIYDLQKASILKRISAFLLDFILLLILTAGFIALLTLIVRFDFYYNQLAEYDKQYKRNRYRIHNHNQGTIRSARRRSKGILRYDDKRRARFNVAMR